MNSIAPLGSFLGNSGPSWLELALWWVGISVFWTAFLYLAVFIKGAPTYKFFCSVCGKRYAHSLSRVLLGPGRQICHKCSADFEDESREWEDMTFGAKFEYLFPPTILVMLGLAVLCAAIGAEFTQPDDAVNLGVLAFLMFAVPTVPYFFGRWWLIRKSKKRSEDQEVARVGYRPL